MGTSLKPEEDYTGNQIFNEYDSSVKKGVTEEKVPENEQAEVQDTAGQEQEAPKGVQDTNGQEEKTPEQGTPAETQEQGEETEEETPEPGTSSENPAPQEKSVKKEQETEESSDSPSPHDSQKEDEAVEAEIHFPKGIENRTQIGSEGGKGSVTVISNNKWSAHISPEGCDWLAVNMPDGDKGDIVVGFDIKENLTDFPREAYIVFTCGDKSVKWLVEQKEKITYMDSIELPNGTEVVCPETGAIYKIVKYMNSGSFGNTYHVVGQNKDYVLKEFCPKGAIRRKNDLKIEFAHVDYSSDTIKDAEEKFRKEPERIGKLFEVGKAKATNVSDDMNLDDAHRAARDEVGPGGIFEWGGIIRSTYTDEEKKKLNLAFPETNCFEFKGNLYYVMERAKGKTLFEFMANIKSGNKKDLDLILKIMEQLAIAVQNIHQDMKCVHLDLSPGNIIFNLTENNQVQLKVIDFGMAANLEKIKEDIERYKEDIEQNKDNKEKKLGSYISGGTKGFTDAFTEGRKPLYWRNPEHIELIDIFSMGAILYFMVIFKSSTIWRKDMEDLLIKEILDMHIYQKKDYLPCIISNEDNYEVAFTKELTNQIYLLAKKATACTQTGFDNRFQSAGEFLFEIHKLMYRIHWKKNGSLSVDALQKGASLTFNTNIIKDTENKIIGKWKASIEYPVGSEEWISFDGDKTGRNDGDHTLEFNIEPNTTDKVREATVVVKTGIMTIRKTIEQKAAAVAVPFLHFVGVEKPVTTFGSLGGDSMLAFVCNRDVTVKVSEGDDSWLSAETKAGKKDEYVLNITTQKNETPDAREGLIWVESDNMKIEASVKQDGKTIEKPDIHFPRGIVSRSLFNHEGGKGTITVIANNEWKAQVQSLMGYDWLIVKTEAGHKGENVVEFEVKENLADSPREAHIVFTCGDKSVKWLVEQHMKPRVKIVFRDGTITEHKFPSAGGQTSCNFSANYESHVEFEPKEAADWLDTNYLEFEPGEQRTLVVTAHPNTTKDVRTASIRLVCGKESISFGVTQDENRVVTPPPPPPHPTSKDVINALGAQSLTFDSDSTTSQKMIFTCNGKWDAIIPASADWIKVDTTNGNAGSWQVGVSVKPNHTGKDRTAKITVKVGTATKDYTIIQEAADELHSIDTTTLSYNKEGGVKVIRFQCNKPWKVTPSKDSESWLRIDSTQGNAGKIDLQVAASTNNASANRNGMFTVSCGKKQIVYTVKQDAGKIIVTPEPDKKEWKKWMKWTGGLAALILAGFITWKLTGPIIDPAKPTELTVPSTIFIAHDGGDKTVDIKANDVWKAEIVEQEPEGWLGIKNEIGDDKRLQFLLTAGQNHKYEPKKATVKVTSGDVSRLVRITQGIDRADSLQTQIEGISRDMSRIVPFIKTLDRRFSLYEIPKGATEKVSVDDALDVILRKLKPDMVIGQTHDISEFEENTETGKIKSITLKER